MKGHLIMTHTELVSSSMSQPIKNQELIGFDLKQTKKAQGGLENVGLTTT